MRPAAGIPWPPPLQTTFARQGSSQTGLVTRESTFHDLDNLTGSDGEPGRQDIGGTNAQTDCVDMLGYSRAVFFAILGSWHATDDLDECRIESADVEAGTNKVEVTTDGSGLNYDTDAPIDADGDFVIIEVRAENIDSDNANPQRWLRGYVAEGGNTGTDNVAAMLTQYDYTYPAPELQGAASASKVYVNPST